MLSPCLSNFCICGILLAVCVIGVPSFKLQQFKGVHSLTGVPFHRFSLLRPPILQNEVKFHSRDGLSPLIATKILNDYNLEVGSKPHSVYNIPNALTFIRLLSIPVFAIASYSNMHGTAFLIFITAGITDYLDGYLARTLKQESSFGAFLDPVADKLMVACALVFILARIPSEVTALPIAMIIAREISVSALREWMASRSIRGVVKVGRLGKIKTALQMASVAVLLLTHKSADAVDMSLSKMMRLPLAPMITVGIFLLYGAALASVISGTQYFIAAIEALKTMS